MKHKRKIIFIILLIIFITSTVTLGRKFLEYHEGDSEYNQIEKQVIIKKKSKKTVGNKSVEAYEDEEFTIDFKKLKSENKDTVGWIKFEEPSKINYPILQGSTNNEYLRSTFYHKYNILGSIFMESDNSSNFSDYNTVIYGHNIKNGSMFGSLVGYVDEVYYSKHKDFDIYLDNGQKITYRIFNVAIVKADSFLYELSFDNKVEFQEYLYKCCEEGLYNTEVLPFKYDSILTLSTCTNEVADERLVIQAIPIEK